eukprot:COSAG02_NODE_2350_length_9082_cov_4.100857_8_plen_960_part_01
MRGGGGLQRARFTSRGAADMDDELERQVALAKAAVQQARSRAIAHVQAAQSQMEYGVTSLQAMTLEQIQDQRYSQSLHELWAAWVGQLARSRRTRHLLRKALSHRDEHILRTYFSGWVAARRRLVMERVHALREEVVKRELQLGRIQGDALPTHQSSTSVAASSRQSHVLQADMALDSHPARPESELQSAQQETAAAEWQSARVQETLRERERDLASVRTESNATESELADYRAELEESLSVSDAIPVESDPEITRLRQHVEKQELQIADAIRARSHLENAKEEELERLEDELNQQVRLRTSAKLYQDSMRKRLAKYEDELKEYRSAIQATDDQGASTDSIQSDLQKEKSLRVASERKLEEQERKMTAMEMELVEANEAAETAIQELHNSTGKLRASVEDQMVEQRGSIKAAALSMDATRRQVEAYEQDLEQARAATKHAEEELALQRDAHKLRVQSENTAVAGSTLDRDELRTKLHAVQQLLRDAKEKAPARQQAAHTESDKLAAQVAEQDAATERSIMHASAIAQQIENQQAELAEINAEIEDIGHQRHAERLAIGDSVGQQLLEESMGAQSLKLIHESALRTFAAVEDRLNEAKRDAENVDAKSDAQRLQLTKLVREAQRARHEADDKHRAETVKQAKLQAEIDDTRAIVSSLEASVHTRQAELGDRRRKAASAHSTDETKSIEQSRMITAQQSELARVRKELSETQTEMLTIRDAHGGEVHEASMKRRLAEQEVELLRQQLEELVETTPKLRSQCLVAETECRRMQVQLSRMKIRPTLQPASELIGLQNSSSPRTPTSTSSAVHVGLDEYAQRRTPPRVPPRTVSPVDEPVLMDIDTIIRQVAKEHAHSVASGHSQAVASTLSPLPKFSPPRSPAPTAASPKRVPRQPNLFSPGQEKVDEAIPPSRYSPVRRYGSATAVAPRVYASPQREIGLSSRMDPAKNCAPIPPRDPSSIAT